jgi:hypothetical protein
MAVRDEVTAPPDTSGYEERLAATRARVAELLKDPDFAARYAAALEEQPDDDPIVARARAGEFAEQAFIEGYGEEFVRELKARYGG